MDRRLATKVLQELVVGRLHGLLLSLRSSSDINTGQWLKMVNTGK